MAQMVLVRARKGVHMTLYNPLTYTEEGEAKIGAIFFLVSPEGNPTQHLRILARIAERVEEDSFIEEWDKAQGEQQLRQCLLHDDRFLTLSLSLEDLTKGIIGKSMNEVQIPTGCLIAMLHRDGNSFVPTVHTIFEAGDRLTIIGETTGLAELRNSYGLDNR